ncbi:urease accessory protein UreD [Yinghuangia sp. ASG 101]|uniref:urease accessory protein UreD n=1 Tax=Yinghuangia sp. ASG 101 TaxID=2896848 RepID=UPI001E3B1CC4|nr:urease accessory protein UreD [Yinghuangia sp. ASG 101]UGQ12729.1 urease accessory protein UreD [Yinghuangia sp. ASG 101]
MTAAASPRDRIDRAGDRVPPEFAALAGVPDTLPAWSPAKAGVLDLEFAYRGGQTELVGRYQKSPLQMMRPLYIDPHLPDMAFVYVMVTGAGATQADRYRTDVVCGPDTRVHVTGQAATKVHRMEFDYATHRVGLRAAAGAYLEYLPDPVIPFRDARYFQHTDVVVEPGATVVLGETVVAGRIARGERHAYRVLATDLEIRRPSGALLAIDTLRLEPGRGAGVLGPGVLGGHDLVASLFVVTDRVPADDVARALLGALDGRGVLSGVSVLPDDCGAWARVLGDDEPELGRAQRAAWDAVRRLLTGTPAPDLRKP